jgi:hypothetical protein
MRSAALAAHKPRPQLSRGRGACRHVREDCAFDDLGAIASVFPQTML